MLRFIELEQPFSGQLADSGCQVKIEAYLPVVCTAIHAGSGMRPELEKQCQLSAQERFFEEDPFTDEMIASQPITLCGLDSRFEYDLNRPKTLSTYYKSAWSKKVWTKPLSSAQRQKSHSKHELFYLLYKALIKKLETQFGLVIVFDLHSYNYQRIDKSTPVFNIGSAQIDMERWGAVVKKFTGELKQISLPNLTCTAEVNAVFEGRGYLISHTNAHFDRTLVLPTEVKKIFMDEQSGEEYPLVLEAVQIGLKQAISNTSAYFQRRFNLKTRVRKADMLSSQIEPSVLLVDKALYRLAQKVETLKYVNPTNLVKERARFFAAPGRYRPDYRYRQLPIKANDFKHQLYKLPIDNIADPDMRLLYSDMVNKLSEQVDLLTSVGQESFLYNSLKYHGRPDTTAIKNAQFLLYAKTLAEEAGEIFTSAEAKVKMAEAAKAWDMKCRIVETSSLAARAMVSSVPPTLYLNNGASFSQAETNRLIQHELGVHMATTLNARMQPLNIFRLGLPGSTATQEGLAILAEYKSGHMSHERLQTLSVRVLAVDSMLKEQDFYQTYSYLLDELGLDRDSAFNITTRVYRGGGLTKDYLYLVGFIQMLRRSQQRSLDNLLIGKCSGKYHDLIDELVERKWLQTPHYRFDISDNTIEPVLMYLIDSLQSVI